MRDRPNPRRRRTSIPPKFDVRRLVKPRADKRGRQLQGFETPPSSARERIHRITLLRQGRTPSARTSEKNLLCRLPVLRMMVDSFR